jgi:hypothetical protein
LANRIPVNTTKTMFIIKAVFDTPLATGNIDSTAMVGITDQYQFYGGVYVGLNNFTSDASNTNLRVMAFTTYDGFYAGGWKLFNPATAISYGPEERTIVIVTYPHATLASNYWEVWIDGVFICSSLSAATVGGGTMGTPNFSTWIPGTQTAATIILQTIGGGATETKASIKDIITLSECWS